MITQPRFLLSYENNKYNLYKKKQLHTLRVT